LIVYTEVMVANPKVLDWLEQGEETDVDDWLNDVGVVVRRPKEIEAALEELAEFV